MSWISFEPVLSILALCPLYLYVITTRSWREGVDRHSEQPVDPEGLPRHPEDPEGRTGQPEDVRDRGRPRRSIRFTPIRDWIPIRHCLLDTLRSQIESKWPCKLISSHSIWERSVSSKQCLIGIQSRMGVNLIGLRSLPDPPGFWSPGTSFGIFWSSGMSVSSSSSGLNRNYI